MKVPGLKIENAVVFVTGANRGIGLAFAKEALARGVRRVYAAARDPATITLPGVIPIRLDVTKESEAAAAAAQCPDVTLLVNNAGIAHFGGFLADGGVAEAREHLEVNFFGILYAVRAFAPVLAANGGGAIVNVLSIASWMSRTQLAVYGASKTAAWGLTNALRNELLAQKTQVLGLHMGFVDTDLTKGVDAPKIAPAVIVQRTYDGLEAGQSEVLGDENTVMVHGGLSAASPIYLSPPPY